MYMKKLLLSALLIGSVFAGQAQELNDWENPQVIGINKEPYHANQERSAICNV